MAKKKTAKKERRAKARPPRKGRKKKPAARTKFIEQSRPAGPRVKITVEKSESGMALLAIRGTHMTIGPRTNVLKFGGTMLYWTRKEWSEVRSKLAILSNRDVLIELERAKRASPFNTESSGIIVEWRTFLI